MSSTLHISEIQLFKSLKAKLGEQEAEELVAFVKTEIESEIALVKEVWPTKEDIANAKSELIKWMFVFVFTSTLTTIGAILAIIKLFIA